MKYWMYEIAKLFNGGYDKTNFNEKTNGDNHMNLNDYKPFLHR